MSDSLSVTIVEFESPSIRRNPDGSRPMIKMNRWRVYVDGLHAGFIGFAEGSKLLLTRSFSELERIEIQQKVMELIGRDAVDSSSVPDVPAELFEEPESEDSDFGYDDH